MDMMTTELGTKFCRHLYKNGGVCIFVHESMDFDSISTHHICKQKDLEICAVKLNQPKIKIVIITIYRSSSSSSFGTTTLCRFSPSQPSLSKFFYP